MQTLVDNLPLQGVRVLDLCEQLGQSCGRYLADLGAEVFIIEPPEGFSSRRQQPLHNGQSIRFEVRNANKQSIAIDFSQPQDQQRFLELVDAADFLILDSDGAKLETFGLGINKLRSRQPDLLVLSITDFGLRGPQKDFIGTELVHQAMGTVLCRSGMDGEIPLKAPGEMVYEAASIQAAWVALLAYWQRSRTGKGDWLDFSINDAASQVIDPPIGSIGTGAPGLTAIEAAVYGRPVVKAIEGKPPGLALLYPILKCADGFVRICVFTPRQWEAMSNWMGESHPFSDPKYQDFVVRMAVLGEINDYITSFFADKSRERLVTESKQLGVPLSAIATPDELFSVEHFNDRNFFKSADWIDKKARVPAGFLSIDDKRVGVRNKAPALDEHSTDLLGRWKSKPRSYGSSSVASKPFQDLMVLDLGVIVAGGELSRYFADQGADVLKIETKNYPDGLRAAFDGNPVPITFMHANRNKRGLALNLRSEGGKKLFYQLVEQADLVLSNFKPGTSEALGVDYKTLRNINPRIICAESSAMGNLGRDAKTLGYGPLVRASTSLSWLWRYPEKEMGFGDSLTIYPDHFASRISATAILAKLIQRQATGEGGLIDLSQAECIINMLATEMLRESVQPGTLKALGNQYEFDAPNSLFQCRGDDQWCAIAVSNDAQWQSLCQVMQRDDLANNANYASSQQRVARRENLEQEISDWCAGKDNIEVMALCQKHGVPAGNMRRMQEFLENPQLKERNYFRSIYQPTVGRAVDAENRPVGFSEILPEPETGQAPLIGEHTREILKEKLALTDAEIDALAEAGDIEVITESE